MNYAMGHAFCTSEIFKNFPYKKMNMKCKDSLKLTNANNREPYVCKIFRTMFSYIIQDIIDNNIIFQLPTGKRTCEIYMDRIIGDNFNKCRQKGKWKGLNVLATNFSGYQLVFKMPGIGNRRTKTIYLNKDLRDHIIDRANNKEKMLGIKYKTTKDYIESAKQLFPHVTKMDLKAILNYGFRTMYMLNSYGADTLITDSDTWIYIGQLMNDSIKYFHYYRFKMLKKLRLTYKIKKIQWDGYYYFALNQEEYQNILEQKNRRGRKRKTFDYNTIKLYKIFDECNLSHFNCPYIFKLKMPVDIGFISVKRNFKTDQAELILERTPLKFQDILLNNNNYEYI